MDLTLEEEGIYLVKVDSTRPEELEVVALSTTGEYIKFKKPGDVDENGFWATAETVTVLERLD